MAQAMSGSDSPASRRTLCTACALPLPACLCEWVRPVANRVELIVLQHPQEQHQAKGTVRLLSRCLQRCRVLVGEQFDPADLLALGLHEAGTALLYPLDESADAGAWPQAKEPARLVLLDATWRKSRKLLHLNPLLQQLPRQALAASALPPSRYAIRKAQRPEQQRSSLEAAVLALQQVESQGQTPAAAEAVAAKYAPLWAGFEGFVAQRQGLVSARPDPKPESEG